MRIAAAALGLAAFTIFGTVSGVSAKVTQYECRFEESRARGGGWVPLILYLVSNEETGELLVYDPLIEHFYGKPIAAELTSETPVRKTFSWDITARVKGQAPRFFYTLSYFTNGKPAKLRAHPGGYDNTFSGEGRCTVSAG